MATTPLARHHAHQLYILGAGSLGMMLAAKLRKAVPDFPVTLLVRGSTMQQHNLQSSTRPPTALNDRFRFVKLEETFATSTTTKTGDIPRLDIPVQSVSEFSNGCQSPESRASNDALLVVTTKAYQVKQALQSLTSNQELASAASLPPILLLCNGALAVRDELKLDGHASPFPSVHLGWTSHGAYQRERPNHHSSTPEESVYHIVHAGLGRLHVSSTLEVPWLVSQWQRAGVHAETSDTVEAELWLKLAANVVINPLTAIHQCRNGDLPSVVPDYQTLRAQLVQELAQVTARAYDDPNRPSSSLSSPSSADWYRRMMDNVDRVVEETAGNTSSMLQDIQCRRRTEVNYLNGYVVKLAERYGLRAPAHSALMEHIADLEQNF